jgi:hypothetical protein
VLPSHFLSLDDSGMHIQHLSEATRLVAEREKFHRNGLDLLTSATLSIEGRKTSLPADRYQPSHEPLYRAVAEIVRAHMQDKITAIEAELTRLGATFDPIVLPLDPMNAHDNRTPGTTHGLGSGAGQ